MTTGQARINLALRAAVLFVAMAAVFAAIRTNDYGSVDGAFRAVAVYFHPGWTLHDNNHLLYPVDINAWSRILGAFGDRPASPDQFMRVAQLMNAVAAAGCVAILYCLLDAIGAGAAALVLALGYGFARAFILHATNSAEPMVGLLWSFGAAGLAVLAHRRRSIALALLSGALLALAMATYQSMVLPAPALVVLLIALPGDSSASKLMRAAAICAGFSIAVVVVFGVAYSLTGTATIAGAAARFLKIGGGPEHFAGWRASKLVNLPAGLASALAGFIPAGYAGLRWLLSNARAAAIALASFGILLASAWLAGLAAWSVMRWRSLGQFDRAVLTACAIGLLFTAVPLIYWDPMYDKLWLQPLAILFVASAVVAKNLRQGVARVRLQTAAAIALAIIALWNVRIAVAAHLAPTPYLVEAERLGALVRPNDLVIVEWDGISQIYEAFSGPFPKTIDFPSDACAHGAGAEASLAQQIRATASAGGRIFFVGVLDTPEAAWDPFLGARCGVPYHSFDQFRRCSEVVAEFPYRGSNVVMRRLGGSNPGCAGIGRSAYWRLISRRLARP